MAGVAIVSSKTGLLQKPQDQMVPPEAVTAHISRFRVRNPLPDRSIDDVTPAYGDRELPKLVRLLRHSDSITRDKTLVSLATVLQKPQLRASGVSAGLVEALVENLSDETLMIRAHAAAAFNALAGHPLGVAAIVSRHALPALVKLLDDKEDIVRSATYEALITVGKSAAGAGPGEGWSGSAGHESGGGGGGGAIVDCKGDFTNMTGYVIGKCVTEEEHLQPFALDLFAVMLLLTRCVDQALCSVPPGIESMTNLLDSDNPQVKQKAAECLMPLTFPSEAKEIVVKSNTILKLVPMLANGEFKTRAAAAAALAAVCVDEVCRQQAVKEGRLLQYLSGIVGDTYDSCQLYGVKLLGIFVENPEWRRQLTPVKQTLEELVRIGGVGGDKRSQTRVYVLRSAERTLRLFENLEYLSESQAV